MICYAKRYRGKRTVDKISVSLWLIYLFINVAPHFIIQMFGGVGNLLLTYIFLFFFLFIYGEPREYYKVKINTAAFFIFLIFYIFLMQFVYEAPRVYYSFGVAFEVHVWNMTSFVPIIMSSICILKKSDTDMCIWIKNVMQAIILIVSVYSLSILTVDSSLAKQSATGHGAYIPFLIDYAETLAFAVTIPFLIQCVHKSKHKKLALLCVVLAVLATCFASFLIAISAMIFGVALYFLLSVSNKTTRYFLVIFLTVGILSLTLSGALEKIVTEIANVMPMEEISKRLLQILDYGKTGVAKDTTERFLLYGRAVKLIIAHPITGNILWNSEKLSDHSTILDVWGGTGLFVLLALMLFFVSIYQFQLSLCQDEKARAATKASAFSLFFVALFNPIFASWNICVLWILSPVFTYSERSNSFFRR